MIMSGVVRQEILFFITSMLTGLGLLWIYDIFIFFRNIFHHREWLVSLEDFVYWCFCAGIIFAMIFERNNGIIRSYAFVGILTGVWIQWKIQSLFQKFWIKLLKKRRKTGKMAKSR